MTMRWIAAFIIALTFHPATALVAKGDPAPHADERTPHDTKSSDPKKSSGNSGQPGARRGPAKRARPTSPHPVQGKAAGRDPQAAVRALKQVIGDATMKDLTLEDFFEWVERATGARVIVRWKRLNEAGISAETTLSLSEKNIPLRQLFVRIFDQLAQRFPDADLAVRTDRETLLVSTRKDINSRRFTRVYDVEDLLAAVPNFAGPGIDSLGLEGDNGFRMAAGAVKSNVSEKDAMIRRLIEIIVRHVEPASWQQGGGKGTIRHFSGRLVIYNNLEVHQRIAEALASAS